jgi:ribose transport system permease protein
MTAPQTLDVERPIPARRLSVSRGLRTFGTLFAFLLMVAFFWWQRPTTFMTIGNWLNITQQISFQCVLAFTMTVVMCVGDFDLSVGSMASLAGIVAGIAFQNDQGIPVAVSTALGAGILGGALNGILVAYVGISAFVATLGTLTIFSGLAFFISGGSTIFGRTIPEAFGAFGNGGIPLGKIGTQNVMIPNLSILALLTLIIIWIVLEQTVFGRRLYAIGGNQEAARLGGVRVRRLRFLAFVISGLGAAMAGLMLASRVASANPKQGDGYMLPAIAAVFLGMTMSEEGEPHVLGTLVGVLIIGVLVNGLTQLSIDSYIQQMLTGAIIILAVTLSSLSRRS